MTLNFLPPALDEYDAAVDEAIATGNGDIRAALKALIIANEFLERDLEKTLASSGANTGPAGRSAQSETPDHCPIS